MSKITNNSNTKGKSPKNVISNNAVEQHFFWKAIPKKEEKLNMLAEKYLHWAENDPKAFKVSQFVIKERISLEDFYDWMEQNPRLKQAHKWVLLILGDRREVGALENKLNANMVMKVQAHYDPVWREQEIFRASLAKTEEDKKQNITIVVEKFPELESK